MHKPRHFFLGTAARAALTLLLASVLHAQVTNVLFSENFSGNTIDPAKFTRATPFFEGGVGEFDVTQHDGVIEFTGTVSQQWWPAATLQLNPVFRASEETNIVISVDRVSEAGFGTASRSMLWILDPATNYFVLFADVRAEGGWRYNRKIGVAGDVPTGSGTEITTFNPYEDLGLYNMKMVANGKNVRLYLDDLFGAQVNFPFSEFVFQFGTAARANGDTADTIFDNLKVEAVGTVTFSTTALRLGTGQTATGIVVRIPPGANATTAVPIRVVSSRPAVANTVGATGGTLTLNFPAGGPNTQTIDIQALSLGASRFTLTNDVGLLIGNQLDVTVVSGPGVLLTEDFASGAVDPAKWFVSTQGFEGGSGVFDVKQAGGRLTISGYVDTDYWPGASLKTTNSYTASEDLLLSFEVDRVAIDPLSLDEFTPSTAARTGVYITTDDRSQYVFFGQNLGENGWQVNVNPGSPTGSGINLPAFDALDQDTNSHRLKLLSDGKTVEVFLDGQSGGRFDFANTAFTYFEVGAYARAFGDAVDGVFDNVKIEHVLPCIKVDPPDVSAEQGSSSTLVKVTIPRLLNAVTTKVTITSRNPAVAIPEGAANGALTLTYATGTTNVQSFKVVAVGVGTTTFDVTNDQGACVAGGINVTVTPPPLTLLSDDFSGTTLNGSRWRVDPTPLVPEGVATADSAVSLVEGVLTLAVTGEVTGWPGFAVLTVSNYTAEATRPVTFEVDRTKLNYTLVTGTSAKQRTGLWVTDETRSRYVFFNEYKTHDGSAGGWEFARVIGQAGDGPLALDGAASTIAAFNTPQFNDGGRHRLKAVANGSTVKLFLDDVPGAEVPFPVASGIVFGVGAYVRAATDVMSGLFDNALITQPGAAVERPRLSIARQGNSVTLTWTGAGTLESAEALTATTAWAPVVPAPTGNTYTVVPTGPARFYRVRQ